MAKIWFVKDGEEPTLGTFETEKTLRWYTDNLGLGAQDWEAPLSRPPHFGESTPLDDCNLSMYVIVEVGNQDRADATDRDWQAGYYLSSVSVEAAREALGTS